MRRFLTTRLLAPALVEAVAEPTSRVEAETHGGNALEQDTQSHCFSTTADPTPRRKAAFDGV
jgi:hypothetical protein